VETVRTHVKRVLAKAGCRRQAEWVGRLERLLARMPPV